MEVNDFRREVIERLTRIEEQTRHQGEAIAVLNKSIHGNGTPGLRDRVLALENSAEASEKHKGGVYAVIAWLVTTAIALYGALKNQ